MRAYRGAAALAAIALAGCASTQGPSSVPTNLKNGQSWIITRQSVAEQVLQTCSRDSPARHPGRVSGYGSDPGLRRRQHVLGRAVRAADRRVLADCNQR